MSIVSEGRLPPRFIDELDIPTDVPPQMLEVLTVRCLAVHSAQVAVEFHADEVQVRMELVTRDVDDPSGPEMRARFRQAICELAEKWRKIHETCEP